MGERPESYETVGREIKSLTAFIEKIGICPGDKGFKSEYLKTALLIEDYSIVFSESKSLKYDASALAEIKPTVMLTVPLIIEKIYFNKILPTFREKWILKILYKVALEQQPVY